MDEDLIGSIAGAAGAVAAWQQAVSVLHQVVASECSSGASREPDGGLVFVESIGPQADEVRGMRIAPGVGCAGFSVERRMSLLVRDVRSDSRFFPGVDEAVGYLTHALLAVPVLHDGDVFGCLEAINPPPDQPFTEADLARAERIARALAERLAGIAD